MQPSVLRIDVQYPLPGNAHPFRRHGDEREDKALEPALHVNAGEDAADLAQQVQVEVLQHGGEEQEHRVVLHCGKREVRPSEVVVLHVEVLLRGASLVVLVDDLFLRVVVVVGQYGAVHVFHSGQELLSLSGLYFGALHDKPQVPVGEEIGEREGRDVHVLPIDRRVPPFLTLLIHFPAFGTAGGTEVEGIGTQEKLLDEFLGERAAIGTEHAHVQPVCLYVVEHVRQLLHLLELNIRVPCLFSTPITNGPAVITSFIFTLLQLCYVYNRLQSLINLLYISHMPTHFLHYFNPTISDF